MTDETAVQSKPPALVMKESLERIEAKLTQHTDEVQTCATAIEKTCETLLRRLDEPVIPGLQGSIDEILQLVRPEAVPASSRSQRIGTLAGVALGMALLGGGMGWYGGHAPAVIHQRARLMEQVNAALMERYPTLPADLKTKLAAVYTQQRFPTLEQQRGGK